jgi:hypothetical protein
MTGFVAAGGPVGGEAIDELVCRGNLGGGGEQDQFQRGSVLDHQRGGRIRCHQGHIGLPGTHHKVGELLCVDDGGSRG